MPDYLPILFKKGDLVEAMVSNYRGQPYKVSGEVQSAISGAGNIKPFMIVRTTEGHITIDSDNETVRLL